MKSKSPAGSQQLEQVSSEEPAFYKLIHVGKPSLDYKTRGYAIPCYFQPWLLRQNCPASNEILCHALNSTFAGRLICGTLWTKTKEPDKLEHVLPADYHTFTIKSDTLYAHHLEQIIDVQALPLPAFWMGQKDTWVICLETEDKKVIIPYFELLRALFYQTSRRLTDFILSQTPIRFLCRPLVAPDTQNAFAARFCVATTNLTAPEARLLGCLLFDPEITYAFNIAQAYWSTTASKDQTVLLAKGGTLAVGRFNNLSCNASGYNFSCGNEHFFWVHQLEISHYDYSFNQLLFYPLADNQKTKLIGNSNEFAAYSDMLQLLYNSGGIPDMSCRSLNTLLSKPNYVSTFTSRRRETYAARKSGLLPLVVRRSTWAVKELNVKDTKYLDDNSFKELTLPRLVESPSPSVAFSRLIAEFESANYPSKPLTLNNPGQLFGKYQSVFPIDGYAPLPGAIYLGQQHCFPLVEISLANALLYIAQPFPKTNPELTLLLLKQSLTQPTETEFNTLLSSVSPVYGVSDLPLFYKKVNSQTRKAAASNTALLAIPLPTSIVKVDFCLALVENIISRFRKRLTLVLATSLQYPQGLSIEELKAIIYINRNIMKSPDSDWLVRISHCWSSAEWNLKKMSC